MKPFTLQPVLRYRQTLEDKAVVRLLEAENRKNEKAAKLAKARKEYAAILKKYQKMQRAGMNIDDLLRYEDHLQRFRKNIETLVSEYDAAERNVEQKRQLVISRSREKKVLEQLQLRQNTAYQRYLTKKETSLLDEMAVLAHERKIIEP